MQAYKVPKSARTYRETRDDLALTFSRWGVVDWSDEPNVPMARVNSRSLLGEERAITVRFIKDGREVVLSADSQDSPRDNLKLVQLCIDDMRMIERRGLDTLMRSAYLQLEGPQGTVKRDPYEVLGVRPGAPSEAVLGAYRALSKVRHPDAGGSAEAMQELNEAFKDIKIREGWTPQ